MSESMTSSIEDEIGKHRNTIDDVDEIIVQMLAIRYELADDINDLKELIGEEVKDPERETEIQENVWSQAEEKEGIRPEGAQEIFEAILSESVFRQRAERE